MRTILLWHVLLRLRAVSMIHDHSSTDPPIHSHVDSTEPNMHRVQPLTQTETLFPSSTDPPIQSYYSLDRILDWLKLRREPSNHRTVDPILLWLLPLHAAGLATLRWSCGVLRVAHATGFRSLDGGKQRCFPRHAVSRSCSASPH